MTQLAQEKAERVQLAAFVDREQREAIAQLARRDDRSMSSVVRQALGRYLTDCEEKASH
jgi:proline dehydrogenase